MVVTIKTRNMLKTISLHEHIEHMSRMFEQNGVVNLLIYIPYYREMLNFIRKLNYIDKFVMYMMNVNLNIN